jgi:hypothetical protein
MWNQRVGIEAGLTSEFGPISGAERCFSADSEEILKPGFLNWPQILG